MKLSLRTRIFLSMLLLVITASVLIAAVSVYQYREEAKDYHTERLERKESAITASINYILKTTTYPVETDNIPLIFRTEIYEIKDIHSLEIYIYDMDGKLLKSSKASLMRDTTRVQIPELALNGLRNSSTKKYVEKFTEDGQGFRSSYSYITDTKFTDITVCLFVCGQSCFKNKMGQNLFVYIMSRSQLKLEDNSSYPIGKYGGYTIKQFMILKYLNNI